jgi:hypothetical protein
MVLKKSFLSVKSIGLKNESNIAGYYKNSDNGRH